MSMKQIIKEIHQGKNLEVNLPQYASNYTSLSYEYAMIRFALHYYTLYEMIVEETTESWKEETELLKVISSVIKTQIINSSNGEQREEDIKSLDQARKEIMKQIHILTSYTDSLQIYEYVLNRVETKYEPKEIPVEDTLFSQQLTQYIFTTKDNVIINENIKEVIGQLPIRITKAKFFELLQNSLIAYKGAEYSSLDSYIYLLRTGAMLEQAEQKDEYFTKYGKLLEKLGKIEYDKLTLSQFHSLEQELIDAAEEIKAIVDRYLLLEELLNSLYTIVLSYPYIIEISEELCHYKEIIKEIWQLLEKKQLNTISENLTKQLTITEGKQEELYTKWLALDAVLYEIVESHRSLLDSLMLGNIVNGLIRIQKLLSTSIFIDLDAIEQTQKVDMIYIEQVTKQLITEFTNLFQQHKKYVNRAVMASVISKMPVFFNSSEEVSAYINQSLEQCHDKDEKYGAVIALRTIMQEAKSRK